MALFGEKYGDRVRTIRVGDFSLELCGGTHTARSGEIGLVKLLQERGIASGTRRIEAVTGIGSLRRFQSEHALIRALEEQLSVPGERVLAEVERRDEQLRALQRELESQRIKGMREQLVGGVADAPSFAGVKVFARRADGLSPQETRELADSLRGSLRSGVVVLGRAGEGKASLLVAVTEDLRERLPAGQLVKSLARLIGGGGGGRPDLAEAGGKNPERLDEALAQAGPLVQERMEAS